MPPKKKEITSIRRAAVAFDVPRETLRTRSKGHQFRLEQRNHNLRLSETQEDALTRWILSRDSRGVAPRHVHVQEMANLFLQSDTTTISEPIGINWVTNFIKRRDEVKSAFARKYNYSRAQCEDPKVIKAWFKQLQQLQAEYGIQQEDIFNFDETGFAMGLIATSRVVSRAEMPRTPHLIQPGREWVTAI